MNRKNSLSFPNAFLLSLGLVLLLGSALAGASECGGPGGPFNPNAFKGWRMTIKDSQSREVLALHPKRQAEANRNIPSRFSRTLAVEMINELSGEKIEFLIGPASRERGQGRQMRQWVTPEDLREAKYQSLYVIHKGELIPSRLSGPLDLSAAQLWHRDTGEVVMVVGWLVQESLHLPGQGYTRFFAYDFQRGEFVEFTENWGHKRVPVPAFFERQRRLRPDL